jgi:NhaP-type Na+/H+ or K+/H+ antiporter
MAVSGWQLNRFERFLFWAALVLAGLLIVVRIGAVLLLTMFHHAR